MNNEADVHTGRNHIHDKITDCELLLNDLLVIGYHHDYKNAIKYAKIMHPDKDPIMCPSCVQFLDEMKRIKDDCRRNCS